MEGPPGENGAPGPIGLTVSDPLNFSTTTTTTSSSSGGGSGDDDDDDNSYGR